MDKPDAPPPLLCLSPADNVWIAVRSLRKGSVVEIDGELCQLGTDLGLGHKLAARTIRLGEKIIKCNASIGSATRDIATGEHVHLHNMKSDYLPTFERGGHSKL